MNSKLQLQYQKLNQYINQTCTDVKDDEDALQKLQSLEKLFSKIVQNLDIIMSLLKQNYCFYHMVELIYKKNQVQIKSGNLEHIFKDNILISILEGYCILNNIEIEEKEELDVITDDIVKTYLQKIGNIPLLSQQEEQILAKKIQEGDQLARKKLAEHNLRLVVSIAKRYTYKMPLEDLIQNGNLGLMTAVDRFDGSLGYKFSTYATWWIRQAIVRGIDNTSSTIRITVYVRAKLNKYQRIKAKLISELGYEPSDQEMANQMGLSISQVQELENILLIQPESLNQIINDDKNTEVGDLIADQDSLNPEEFVLAQMEKQEIVGLLSTLKKREEAVIRLRYGLDDGIPKTLEVIGQIFGVTRERVRQIEATALRKLRMEYLHISKKRKNTIRKKNVLAQMEKQEIAELSGILEKKEEAVIRLRYGLDDGGPKTVTEIAQIFELTEVRIQQIEASALRKLREIDLPIHIREKIPILNQVELEEFLRDFISMCEVKETSTMIEFKFQDNVRYCSSELYYDYLQKLSDKSIEIFQLYFGLQQYERHTIEQIAFLSHKSELFVLKSLQFVFCEFVLKIEEKEAFPLFAFSRGRNSAYQCYFPKIIYSKNFEQLSEIEKNIFINYFGLEDQKRKNGHQIMEESNLGLHYVMGLLKSVMMKLIFQVNREAFKSSAVNVDFNEVEVNQDSATVSPLSESVFMKSNDIKEISIVDKPINSQEELKSDVISEQDRQSNEKGEIKMLRKIKSIYVLLAPYTKEEIDEEIAKLTPEEKHIIELRYGADLEHPVISPLWKGEYYSILYNRIIPKLKRRLKQRHQKDANAITTSGIENSLENNTEEIDKDATNEVVESVPEILEDNSDIVPVVEEPTDQEVVVEHQSTTLPLKEESKQLQLKKEDYVKMLSLLRTPSFEQLMSSFSVKEAIVIALKLGYVDEKYFSTESIATFLGIRNEEVRDITQKVLLSYKDTFNQWVDHAIEVVTDQVEPQLSSEPLPELMFQERANPTFETMLQKVIRQETKLK